VYLNDGEVLCELLQNDECNDIFEREYNSNSDMNVKMPSYGKQCVIFDEDNANDGSSMHHGIWTKSGAKQPHFPFTGRPGMNIVLEHLINSLEYF
jgi:hypothetical protein